MNDDFIDALCVNPFFFNEWNFNNNNKYYHNCDEIRKQLDEIFPSVNVFRHILFDEDVYVVVLDEFHSGATDKIAQALKIPKKWVCLASSSEWQYYIKEICISCTGRKHRCCCL